MRQTIVLQFYGQKYSLLARDLVHISLEYKTAFVRLCANNLNWPVNPEFLMCMNLNLPLVTYFITITLNYGLIV